MQPGHLFAFGCGYSARRLAAHLLPKGWRVSGSSRTEDGAAALGDLGIDGVEFDGTTPLPAATFETVTHILILIPPGTDGDKTLGLHRDMLRAAPMLQWVGILSTTGIYGDAQGAWITEDFPPAPLTAANEARLTMENGWLAFGQETGIAVQVFRLPGIYGPGRSPFGRLRSGAARRILKQGQVFNRVHVDDIVQACWRGMQAPAAGPVFHIADGVPAPADEVLAFAATLLNMPPPPAVRINDAGLPPMALHFYAECKRLDISRARSELGFDPIHKDFRAGLRAILAEETAATGL